VKILLTGAASDLGRAATVELRRRRHRLRLTDRRRLRTDHDFVQSQLGHSHQTDRLLAGMKAVVHIPGPGKADADAAWIDTCTRCTYNLLVAAVDAGVEHVIYVSSLDPFTAYDPDFLVGPGWRPLPTTAPEMMAPYLGEFIAEEFAQTGQIRLTTLRLGHLVDEDTVGPADPLDALAIDPRDAAAGIAACLDEVPEDFRLVHLQGDFEGARCGNRGLDLTLQHDFGRPRVTQEATA
jgi:nucleoside-diphosphate-sugar epimerase